MTIGIPAYNRPAELERAARSALSQDYSNIEVLVSDDASGNPEVEQVASRVAAADSRVRVVRQPGNLGHAGNYQWLLENAAGEYFMWLSDDDWLDQDYVGRCLAAVRANRATVLACGLARYYRDGAHVLDERPIDLDSDSAARRLIRYFARVSLNGPLFGVARRDDLLAIGFPQVVGGDWLLVAGLAARGCVRTLPDVHVNRSLSGLGSDAEGLARSFGMRGLRAQQHHVVVAGLVWREISAGSGSFGRISPFARVLAGSAAAGLIVGRFTIAGLVRGLLGSRASAWLERWISARLRAWDAR